MHIGAHRHMCMAKIYHPDKGGSALAFRYIKMVFEVLRDPRTRNQYDMLGKGVWTRRFAEDNAAEITACDEPGPAGPPGAPAGAPAAAPAGAPAAAPPASHKVPDPPVNVVFINELLGTRGAAQHYIGQTKFAEHLQRVVSRTNPEDNYEECAVAKRLGLCLRLTAKWDAQDAPVYPQARVVRYAAFMGMRLLEFDIPSSHGQQALKYTKRHGLNHEVLQEAFATTEQITTFRSSLGFSAKTAKRAVNMLVGGSGIAKVKVECRLGEVPEKLLALHAELKDMRKHMMDNCPSEWKPALSSAPSSSPDAGQLALPDR